MHGKRSYGKLNCLLSDDEVCLIFKRLSDPDDRKYFSKVCKQWLRVEGLTRPSILLVGPEFLSQFPNLVTFETSKDISETDHKFIAETCPNIEMINLNSKGRLDIADTDPLKQLGHPALLAI